MSERFARLVEVGETAFDEGRFNDARKHYANALNMRASYAPLLASYINASLKTGKDESAYLALTRLLVLTPDDATATALRARLSFKLRKPDRLTSAVQAGKNIFGKAKGPSREPFPGSLGNEPPRDLSDMTDEQVALAQSIAASIRSRHFDDAARSLDALATMVPEHPEVWSLRGRIALGIADFHNAFLAFEEALKRDPVDLIARCYLIRMAVRSEMGLIERAEEILASFSPQERDSADVLTAEALLCRYCGETEDAIRILQRIETEIEARADVAFLMVETLSGAGRFQECRPWIEKLAERDPMSATAYAAAAVNRQMPPDSAIFKQAAAAADDPAISQEERGRANFALAQALKAAGDNDASIERFEFGNALLDRLYDPWVEDAQASAQIRLLTPDMLRHRGDPERGSGQIFVCGMPRSGSTLVAQIIASHPDAVSIGESPAFYACLERAVAAGYPDRIAEIPDTFFADLGEHYLSLMPPMTEGARYVVDKELLKFRYLGLLKLMLPGARILQTVRDPMDCGFSIFCHWFSGHPYASRYDTIGHFHHIHDTIMAHWHAVMPDDIHTVRYEDLVADPEPQSRALLDAAHVPFHPDCLNFHEAAAMATTSSMYQVRQRIYGSSVGAWKAHEARLQPLKDALAEKPFGPPPEF